MKQSKLPVSLEMWEHVSITWEDAFSNPGAYKADEWLKTWKPCIRRLAGYVLHYSDNHIAVAVADDRQSNTEQDCEDITVVPLAMVRKITRK